MRISGFDWLASLFSAYGCKPGAAATLGGKSLIVPNGNTCLQSTCIGRSCIKWILNLFGHEAALSQLLHFVEAGSQ